MPKKEPELKYKGTASPTIVSKAAVISTVTADHGGLSGLNDDDHAAVYPGYAQDETITGDWTFTGEVDISGATLELPTAAPDADSVDVAASTEGTESTYSRSDHTHNLDEGIAPTWTAGHTFQATMVTRELNPELSDTYDIGDPTAWYSQMFVSQINAAVFAEEQIMLLGGWLYVSHDAGSFAAEVESADTTIDFGKAMTVSDFVVVKAYDITGSIKTEYIQVGALSAGTVYNVTRDLAAAHGTDPNWAAGTPFAVLGQTGDGRIELNAYDAPRIQIIVQDDAVTYSNTTEYLRLGEMNGAFGSDAADEWGFGVGDYSGGNYIAYNTTDGFILKAGAGDLTIDSDGITCTAADGSPGTTDKVKWEVSGTETGYVTAVRGGGDESMSTLSCSDSAKGTATVRLRAFGNDASYESNVYLTSDASADTLFHVELGGTGATQFLAREAGIVFINDDTNTDMTQGLTIQQGANDDEILAFKSSDVAHGITDEAETDTYGTFTKARDTAGGLYIRGYSEASGYGGVNIAGARGDDNTTKSTAGLGNIGLIGHLKSVATVGAPGADANLVVIRSHTNTRFIFDQEGEMHSDAIIGVGNDWDEWDDLALASDLSRLPKAKWDEMMRYQAEDFERAGLLTLSTDEDGTRHAFLKTKAMLQFSMCCFREVYERMQRYERILLDMGASPERLIV